MAALSNLRLSVSADWRVERLTALYAALACADELCKEAWDRICFCCESWRVVAGIQGLRGRCRGART